MDEREILSVGRLVAFTDGVFAIAITLLVLNFDEPSGPDSELAHQLTDQWPALLAYFLSFAVIGRFWVFTTGSSRSYGAWTSRCSGSTWSISPSSC